jgi:hypothetical protein
MMITCDYIDLGLACHCSAPNTPFIAPVTGNYTFSFRQNGRYVQSVQTFTAGDVITVPIACLNESGCASFNIYLPDGTELQAYSGCLWTEDFINKWFDFWQGFHAGTDPPVPTPPIFANFCDDAVIANAVFAGIENIITDFVPYFVNTGDAACEYQTATFEELITPLDARDGAIFLQARSVPTPRGWGYQLWCEAGVPHFEAYLSATAVNNATPTVTGGFPPYKAPTGFIKVAEGIGAVYNEYRELLPQTTATGEFKICTKICYDC